jgi:hypothetical protein
MNTKLIRSLTEFIRAEEDSRERAFVHQCQQRQLTVRRSFMMLL